MTGITDPVALRHDLAGFIGRARGPLPVTEADMHERLARLIASAGYAAEPGTAPGADQGTGFLVEGGIAVEVDAARSVSELEQQVRQRLSSRTITGILVVTTRAQHCGLPPSIDGWPVRVLWEPGGF